MDSKNCNPDGLMGCIKKIDSFTRSKRELCNAHHYLFDLKVPPNGSPKYVLMGLNPAEFRTDWEKCPQRTEETSRYDWYGPSYGKDRATIRWSRAAARMLSGADYVMTELFFWSSANLAEAERRFGVRIERSPYLEFCRSMNAELLEFYQPTAVVMAGLAGEKLAVDLYGLRMTGGPVLSPTGKRLVVFYNDGKRPWLFTPHWTGAWLSAGDRELISGAIRNL